MRGAAVTELYFWDGWQCVVEATTAGAVTKEYVYGEGIDEVLKARLPDAADLDSDSNTSEKVDLYYHQNSLGSVLAVTDSAGDVVESYRYSPCQFSGTRDALPERNAWALGDQPAHVRA